MTDPSASFSLPPYEEQFTDAELARITEEGLIYMCACPAQVATSIRQLRDLYRYQQRCLRDSDNNTAVHGLIAGTTMEVLRKMEACMAEVLELEGWDRATLQMPDGLRKKQLAAIRDD